MIETGLQTAQRILGELRRLRSTVNRDEAAAKLNGLANDAYGPNGSLMPDAGGVVAFTRWKAAQAIAALKTTCEKTNDPVPDSLWAEVDRRVTEWMSAEK